MKALVTGASSGIGRDIARELAKRGISLVLTARRREPMEKLKEELAVYNVDIQIMECDLSKTENVKALYEKVRPFTIDILINNAGFGVFGAFTETDLDRELEMLNTNITAVHTLMKLFLRDFRRVDSGYILNVASSAAFLPGPLFSSYYASKAYILRLTQAVSYELKKARSRVYVGALCPGPVRTEFDTVANVKFSIASLSSEYVARYAVCKMFDEKTVIVPGFNMKMGRITAKIFPEGLSLAFAYHTQRKKTNK